ncbi:fibrinogen C domain-containing protein 1-like [Anopheles albimanus]|uniref:fibrinogen C domain-containing protein 1-like n=1 Tax=Anopheles albimanus TaxID=7167 RepID=UPI001640A8D3|nr:fibrinogen C domain-containing protein 1-like [Anopheles albimanus]
MKLRIGLNVLCAIVYVAASDRGPSKDRGTVNRPSGNGSCGQSVDGSRCRDVASNVSGIYSIRIKNDSEPFEVYCEQTAFGGGWIVFQYRYDGSLDFYRGWNEFRDGFGDLNKEFWLGLEKIHQITKDRTHEMIIELKDFDGSYKYIRFREFGIGSESEQYALEHLTTYGGTLKNDMADNVGMKFSTKDRDNDKYQARHCAQYHESGWWYESCTYANLNGRYINAEDVKSMFWWDFKTNREGLSYSRMMIREVE